jgi:hypothetical protein
MDRPGIHDIPKARVLARLRDMQLDVQEMEPLARYDFLLNGKVRVALRSAFPSSYRRRVRLRKRQYSYVYRAWNFNFHHRGHIDERYCDYLICVPLGTGRLDLRSAYVIPWEARTGKTFYLPDSQRTYSGKYVAYRDGWQQLREAANAHTKAAKGPRGRARRKSASSTPRR